MWFSSFPCRVNKKMKFSGKQVAAARELLGLSQTDLAKVAGVGRRTLGTFERGDAELKASTLTLIQAELERRGIEFTNGKGIGVRLNFEKAEEFARSSPQARNESER
jgi:transcriptional regulator with XRE-family HTH domain